MQRLSQYINTSVQVAGDALFGDTGARLCLLVAVEDFGVWLKNDELSSRIYSTDDAAHAQLVGTPVFIPFAQVQYIAPAQLPVSAAQAAFARASEVTLNRPSTDTRPTKHGKPEPKHGKK